MANPWKWLTADKIDEGRWYWWWNGDEDSAPVPVHVQYLPTSGTYFASSGQLGWNRSQGVIDMGGWWMPLYEPETPVEVAVSRLLSPPRRDSPRTPQDMTREKYHRSSKADRTDAQGIVHDSKAEMRRWGELKLLERSCKISDLRRQVRFDIVVNGYMICSYLADFAYCEDGATVVEDVKGCKTPIYQLKKKLMRAVLGIEIREIKVTTRRRRQCRSGMIPRRARSR